MDLIGLSGFGRAGVGLLWLGVYVCMCVCALLDDGVFLSTLLLLLEAFLCSVGLMS